jgi:hypothetical protein
METFNRILISSHSGWRWIVLILIVAAVVKMHMGWKGKKAFTDGSRKLALFTMIAFHLQFLFGWILYFTSSKVGFFEGMMKDAMYRFFTVEHSLMMTIAMVLITIGYSKSKKKKTDTAKFKVIAVMYTIALVLILAAIPWPFREALGAGWF